MASEADLVQEFAAELRLLDWTVWISRPNQTSMFFTASDGRRKSPDLIATCGGLCLVIEAKPRVRDLFRDPVSGQSDARSLEELDRSPEMWTELSSRLVARFGDVQGFQSERPVVGLLAGERFSAELGQVGSSLLRIWRLGESGTFNVAEPDSQSDLELDHWANYRAK